MSRSRGVGRGAGVGRVPGAGRVCGALALCALTATVAGCGGGQTLPDLFAVRRSGSVPGANLRVVVNDGGTVTCNGGAVRPISDPQLLEARSVSSDLHDYAARGLALRPGPQPVLSYAVRTKDGHVSFSDDSAGQPTVLYRLALLVREIAQQDCRLAR